MHRLSAPTFLGMVLLTCPAAHAQRPDFSGRWALDKAASRVETPEFAQIDRGTVVIAHREPAFALRRSFLVRGAPDTSGYALATDSGEVERPYGPGRSFSRLYWVSDTLVYAERIVMPQGEATNVVRYTRREGGQVLVAHERFRAPRMTHDNLWVFARERGDGRYFGQALPGDLPQPFAPETSAAWHIARTPALSPAGDEMTWSVSAGQWRAVLVTSRYVDGAWTRPDTLPFSTGDWFDHNPAFAPTGNRLVFASNRPVSGKAATAIPGTPVPTSDLFVSERRQGRWSDPVPLSAEINTGGDEDSPCLTGDGTLYFSSSRPGSPGPGAIYRAPAVGDGWGSPQVLPPPVTSGAGDLVWYVAPDERVLIFTSMRPGDAGGPHVAYRAAGSAWGEPVRLPDELRRVQAYALSVTPDGRWLLFTKSASGSGPRLYWIDAAVLRDPGTASPAP